MPSDRQGCFGYNGMSNGDVRDFVDSIRIRRGKGRMAMPQLVRGLRRSCRPRIPVRRLLLPAGGRHKHQPNVPVRC